jgi:hypothetical protein
MINSNTTPDNLPADDGWVDVITETQFTFNSVGDMLIGTLAGWSESESYKIPQAHFTTDAGRVFINCGWSLKLQLKSVKVGTLCRIVFMGLQDTGQETPMRIFKVQTKK